MKELKSFLGTGWSFPPTFEIGSKSVQMVSDEEDIKQSLQLLMSTYPGERITNPEYGCDLRKVMFQDIDQSTRFLIKDVIADAVLLHESRVTLEDVEVETNNEIEGLINITLHYVIRKVNIRDNVVFPFYKVEGTNVVEV